MYVPSGNVMNRSQYEAFPVPAEVNGNGVWPTFLTHMFMLSGLVVVFDASPIMVMLEAKIA